MVVGAGPLNFFMNRLLFVDSSSAEKIEDVDVAEDRVRTLPERASRSFNKQRELMEERKRQDLAGSDLPQLVRTYFHEIAPQLKDSFKNLFDEENTNKDGQLSNVKEEPSQELQLQQQQQPQPQQEPEAPPSPAPEEPPLLEEEVVQEQPEPKQIDVKPEPEPDPEPAPEPKPAEEPAPASEPVVPPPRRAISLKKKFPRNRGRMG